MNNIKLNIRSKKNWRKFVSILVLSSLIVTGVSGNSIKAATFTVDGEECELVSTKRIGDDLGIQVRCRAIQNGDYWYQGGIYLHDYFKMPSYKSFTDTPHVILYGDAGLLPKTDIQTQPAPTPVPAITPAPVPVPVPTPAPKQPTNSTSASSKQGSTPTSNSGSAAQEAQTATVSKQQTGPITTASNNDNTGNQASATNQNESTKVTTVTPKDVIFEKLNLVINTLQEKKVFKHLKGEDAISLVTALMEGTVTQIPKDKRKLQELKSILTHNELKEQKELEPLITKVEDQLKKLSKDTQKKEKQGKQTTKVEKEKEDNFFKKTIAKIANFFKSLF